MNKILFVSVFLLTLAMCGCGEEKASDGIADKYKKFEAKTHQKNSDDAAIDWNSVNAIREDEDIEFFVKRYGWHVERRGNGLRVEVLEEGSGQLIKSEDVVALEYTTC